MSARSASGAVLTAEHDGSRLLAAVVLAELTTASVTLKEATGDAGLFRAEQIIDGSGFAAGWVVLPDGTVTGQVSATNLPGAVQLPLPPVTPLVPAATGTTAPPATTATTAPTAAPKVVGVVAPAQVAASFPRTPPSDSQVDVVPFNAQEVIDEAPGEDPNGDTAPGGSPTTTIPETRDACKTLDDKLATNLKALQDLENQIESSSLDRKQRHALKVQARGIRLRIDAIRDAKELHGCTA